MTKRIQCDGCGKFLDGDDFIGAQGNAKATVKSTEGGGFSVRKEFVEFHWCLECLHVATEALKKANQK